MSLQNAARSCSDRCHCFNSHSGLAIIALTSSGTLIFLPVRNLNEITFFPLSNHRFMIFHWQLVDIPVISFTCNGVCHCFSIVSSDPKRSQITRRCSSMVFITLRMMNGYGCSCYRSDLSALRRCTLLPSERNRICASISCYRLVVFDCVIAASSGSSARLDISARPRFRGLCIEMSEAIDVVKNNILFSG